MENVCVCCSKPFGWWNSSHGKLCISFKMTCNIQCNRKYYRDRCCISSYTVRWLTWYARILLNVVHSLNIWNVRQIIARWNMGFLSICMRAVPSEQLYQSFGVLNARSLCATTGVSRAQCRVYPEKERECESTKGEVDSQWPKDVIQWPNYIEFIEFDVLSVRNYIHKFQWF